jgi:hypothetical protein
MCCRGYRWTLLLYGLHLCLNLWILFLLWKSEHIVLLLTCFGCTGCAKVLTLRLNGCPICRQFVFGVWCMFGVWCVELFSSSIYIHSITCLFCVRYKMTCFSSLSSSQNSLLLLLPFNLLWCPYAKQLTSLALKNADLSYLKNLASALIGFHPMCYNYYSLCCFMLMLFLFVQLVYLFRFFFLNFFRFLFNFNFF